MPEANEKKKQSARFYELFSFADEFDWFLMIFGTVGAIVGGSSMPNQHDLSTMNQEVSKGSCCCCPLLLRFWAIPDDSLEASIQVMALVPKVPTTIIRGCGNYEAVNGGKRGDKVVFRKRVSIRMAVSLSSTPMDYLDKPSKLKQSEIMVNGCTGKMGKAVIEAAVWQDLM